MTSPVKLSRERWEMLRLGKQWPAVFDPSPEPLSIIITEPLSVGTSAASITFLPAEYVPGEVTWHRMPDPIRITPEDVMRAANYPIIHSR